MNFNHLPNSLGDSLGQKFARPRPLVKGSPATNDGGKGRPGNDLFIVLRDQGVVDAVDVQFAESVVVHPGAEACLGTVRGIIGVCSSFVEKRTDTNKTL